MTPRRAFVFAGLILILFLAVYSWNRRSGSLDNLATNVGLEVSSYVLSPLRSVQDKIGEFWDRYFNLVDVREENIRLKARVEELEAKALAAGEDLAELKRLRELVQFPVDSRWRPLAARVLAGRIGPNGVLDSVIISRGYANGARPGAPLVTNLGLVGRVLRSSPHASSALLLTDPGSRVAVFGQESRAPGILKGHGMGRPLEVDFVQRDAGLKVGEVLVTSGLDNKFPKGLPAARVTGVAPSDYTQFMAVTASPLVDLQHLEETLLLEKSGDQPFYVDPEEDSTLVGPPPPRTRPFPPPVAPRADNETASASVEQNPGDTPEAAAQTPVPTPARPTPVAPVPTAPVTPPRAPAREENSSRPPTPPAPLSNGEAPRNSEGAPKYRIIVP